MTDDILIPDYSVLDELDEDLILELDQVVRENQVACLPIAKSGRAEALLFEKYPELAEQIDRRRRAKVDALMLQGKYADSSARMSSSLKAGSYDDQPSPMQQKARRRSTKDVKAVQESPLLAPALKGKGSVADLMFDMDDDVDSETDELDLNVPRSLKSPTSTLGGPVQDVSLDVPTSSPWQIPKAAPKRDASDSAIASPLSHTPRSLGTPLDTMSTPITRQADKPWGTTPLQMSKLDMKDIMAETSSTQPSNISLALSAQAKEDRTTGSFAATKLSQKERKKLQQQAAKGEAVKAGSMDNEPRPAVSPWQMKPPAAKVALKDVMNSSSPTQTTQQQTPPTTTRPNLTMRQTIANNGSASKAKSSNSIPITAIPAQSFPPQTSPSNTNKNATPSSGKGFAIPRPDAPSSSLSALPQSIRHIASTSHSEASLHLSMGMADILSMQQAEKESIAAAAAKRSLQEIQQEQEFQEWWDKESRRVMEEEKERAKREKRETARASGSSKKTGKKAKGDQKAPGGDETPAPTKGGGAGAKKGGRGKKANAGSGPAPDRDATAAATTSTPDASAAVTTTTANAAPPAKPNRKHRNSGKPGKPQQPPHPHPSVTTTATSAAAASSPAVTATAAAATASAKAEKTPPTGPRKQHHHHRPRGGGGGGGGSAPGPGPGSRRQQQQQPQASDHHQQPRPHPPTNVA